MLNEQHIHEAGRIDQVEHSNNHKQIFGPSHTSYAILCLMSKNANGFLRLKLKGIIML